MAMDRQFIVNEIRRTAAQNQGKPLGQKAFRTETGIAEHHWRGKYWARWGDALIDAGFNSLKWTVAKAEEEVFEALLKLILKYGKYPTKDEILLEKKLDQSIPTPNSLRLRFGAKVEIIRQLHDYCKTKGVDDAVEIPVKEPASVETKNDADGGGVSNNETPASGYVYLARSGRHYKIGRSNSHGRRMYELAIQLPENLQQVHVIVAIDDPVGIERYWHDRFKKKGNKYAD